MLRKMVFVVTVMALVLAAVAGTASAQGGGDPNKGKTLWEQKNCKSCHGQMGEGKYAPPRAGDGRSAADWIKQARTPRANMPAYSEAQVGDADLTDMNAYMQTLPKPASFTPITYTAAAGDPAGKILFMQKRCTACHGDGAGFIKSRFTDKGRTVTAEAVIKQLRTPAQNMPMFNATQVSDQQAGQIAEFFTTLAASAAPAAPAAPAATTVPQSEGQPTSSVLLVVLVVVGLVVLAGIAFALTRRRA